MARYLHRVCDGKTLTHRASLALSDERVCYCKFCRLAHIILIAPGLRRTCVRFVYIFLSTMTSMCLYFTPALLRCYLFFCFDLFGSCMMASLSPLHPLVIEHKL